METIAKRGDADYTALVAEARLVGETGGLYIPLADAVEVVVGERDALRAQLDSLTTESRLDEIESTWGDGMEINFGGQS